MQNVDSRIKAARAKMLVKHPFFATLMMSMPMVMTEDIPTAATDMKSLYVNPRFVESIDDSVLMFVIAHEIMHTALEHGIRRQHRPKMRWNVACDYSINMTLGDAGFKVWHPALHDEKYRNEDGFPMAADTIDRMLEQEERAQPQPQQGEGDGGSDGQSGGSGPSKTGEPGNAHHSPMLGDLKEPEEAKDPVAQERLSRDIQQRVAQAASVARMMGELPAGLARFVGQVLDPKVPWYETLRHFMTEVDKTDEDWTHRNRRFQRIYLPSDRSEDRLGEFIAIGDTSGSIGDEEMMQYISEFRAVAEDCRPERTRLVWADAVVAGEQVFDEHDELDPRPAGGGGTDMRVPLRYVEQYEPKIVVLFTDGYTPWPTEPPPYPLIVCCTTEQRVPVGEVIRI
jgi:predicted metal-dependent peptidase